MAILVTGAAGFIGFHLCKRLLSEGNVVIGVDNINDYYDVNIKHDRLNLLKNNDQFNFEKIDISCRDSVDRVFSQYDVKKVVNLAAQAGVRYSITNPHSYIDSNIVGFLNILEACRHNKIEHLVYASSSSVYGANTKLPFSESDNVDHPVALYAASKKSNELMAHAYSSLYGIPTSGLRFFTVYGPWGRPDMALFLFTKGILEDREIEVYNNGEMYRDFTYIDDIVEGIYRVLSKPAEADSEWSGDSPNPSNSYAPYKIYNIGNNNHVKLMDFVTYIEEKLGKKANKKLMPLQAGDVPNSISDTSMLQRDFDFKPKTDVKDGIDAFVDWYVDYYGYSK